MSPEQPGALSETIGHYRLIRRLGAGGMGQVHLAEDSKLRRKVAIKVLNASAHATGRTLLRESAGVSAKPGGAWMFQFRPVRCQKNAFHHSPQAIRSFSLDASVGSNDVGFSASDGVDLGSPRSWQARELVGLKGLCVVRAGSSSLVQSAAV